MFIDVPGTEEGYLSRGEIALQFLTGKMGQVVFSRDTIVEKRCVPNNSTLF